MSDFSIEYILNRAGEQYLGTNASIGIIERIKLNAFHPYLHENRTREISRHQSNSDPNRNGLQLLQRRPMLDWLQYSRYHPPKLQRPYRQLPSKRTPGRLPRIPFTPEQLQALEAAYKTSTYLSAEDANKLADSLQLTSTRVKIWFQNRRARERRERREKEESCDSTLSSNNSSPEPELISID